MAKSFLYNQIKQDIIHKIDADIYKNGDKLPSEAQLVEEYGVSRNTASRVLNDLVEEGYARRRQGKGTFVYNQKIDNRLQGIQSFTDMFERNNKNPSTKVLAYEVVDEPPARVRENLHLGEGEKAIRLYRVRYADDTPAVLNETFRSFSRFEGQMECDPATVFSYGYLKKLKNIYPVHSEEVLEIALLGTEEAVLLEQKVGAPAFLVKSVTSDNTGQPLEVVKSLYRADLFQFSVVLDQEDPGR